MILRLFPFCRRNWFK